MLLADQSGWPLGVLTTREGWHWDTTLRRTALLSFQKKGYAHTTPPLHQLQLEGVKHRTPHKQPAKQEKRGGLEERERKFTKIS